MGGWLADKIHGQGTELWSDGNTYVGMFALGKREGVGKFISVDGASYEGMFKNGAMSGLGAYTYPDEPPKKAAKVTT